MARTPSNMTALGQRAPSFSLPDVVSKEVIGFDGTSLKGSLVMFICNHCPYVINIESELFSLSNQFHNLGLKVYAINSNDVKNYPDDSPEKMQELANKFNLKFPYLFDETQSVAKAYDAACTPDFFLYDSSGKLFYRGQFDSSRPGNETRPTGKDLELAVEALLGGGSSPENQIPSLGCSIKWK